MSTILRAPYLTPSPERINVHQWQLICADGVRPLGDLIPDWDPGVSITAKTAVEIDIKGVFDDCQLNHKAQLRLSALWYSDGTGLRGRGSQAILTARAQNLPTTMEITVEGMDLAGSLELWICLSLESGADTQEVFAPKMNGSILYKSDIKTVVIEGSGARFPVEIGDFQSLGLPAKAGWHLHWDLDNLHQMVLGEMRLYINTAHKRVIRAVTENLTDDFDLREAIRWDVARMLIYGALENEEFVENPYQFGQGTIGAAVLNMLKLYFPDTSIQDIKNRSWQAERFDPKLQDKLGMFWLEQ